jgi:peptidoglycan lytic transglycosylase G
MRRGGLLLTAIALLGAGAAAIALHEVLSPLDREAGAFVFTVAPGQPLGGIARQLERDGLVRSATAVEWIARLRGLDGSLRAGEYALSASQTPGAILSHLASGQTVSYAVVLPEGFTAAQIGARLASAGLVDEAAFAAAVRDPELIASLGIQTESLEGYLFPDTYLLPKGLAAGDLARILAQRFLAVWREIEPLAAEQGLSQHEVVTLASIVEKETGVPEERPQVAAVFRNRLLRRMRLESDPTVIYGISQFDGNLRRKDLEDAGNRYNTYRIAALPPGPIASPGEASLRAVVAPAKSKHLYFVARNDGTHVFSNTFREHEREVERYQKKASH